MTSEDKNSIADGIIVGILIFLIWIYYVWCK